VQIQSEVANTIAREVRSTLQSGPASASPPPIVKPGAYESYLKGMFQLNKYTEEGFEKGIGHLRHAIENDPNDPHPHAALALGYAMMGHERFPDALHLVKASARRSLELGGNLPEAYAALGMQEMYSDWDMEAGASNLRRALDINPNFAEARRNYAWYLRFRGDRDGGIAELKRAKAIDPLAPQIVADLAWHYLLNGDYAAASREAREALDVNPAFSQALALMSWIHLARGESGRAIELGRKVAETGRSWRWSLGRTYALANRKHEARTLAAKIAHNPQPMDQWGLAVIHSAMGDKDEAMRWLEAAYRSRFSWMPWNKGVHSTPQEDLFGPLEGDPRFEDLARRVLQTQSRR
jgi:tetratricopeptide (TPR) repeat protein